MISSSSIMENIMDNKEEEFYKKAMDLLGVMLEESLIEEYFICPNCGWEAKLKRIIEVNRENIYVSCKCEMSFKGIR